jgi:hypothetical protein
MEPSEKSLDSPTPAITAERTTVLRVATTQTAVRSDRHDATALGQVTIQTVTVTGSVADQSSPETVEETVSEDAFNKLAFRATKPFDANCEWKAMVIGESDDFRSFAALVAPER